jgi:hypothetical protein
MSIETFNPADVYTKLPESTIRILILEPGAPGDELRGRFKLQEFPKAIKPTTLEYEALSYTWGKHEFPQNIMCLNSQIPITQNLFDALCRLRLPNVERNLWIDALCINQRDDSEKSSQILLMRFIYMNARQVIIWLGQADEFSETAFGFIQKAARCARAEASNLMDLTSESYDDSKNIQRGFPSRNGPEGDGLEPLCAFLANPWFTRVWIVQEVVTAGSAVMRSGDLMLPYSDFCAAVVFFLRKGYLFSHGGQDVGQGLIITTHLSRIYWGAPEPKANDLLLLLRLTQTFLATDPRDKVFAVLGLASNVRNLRANCSVSLKKLYVDTAWHLLKEGDQKGSGQFNFFADIDHDSAPVAGDFPSWVPRWNIPRLCASDIHAPSFNINFTGYLAPTRHKDNENIIQVHGCVASEIETDMDIGTINFSWERMWELLRSIRNLALDLKTQYPTGEDWHKVFAQVLTPGSRYFWRAEKKSFGTLDYRFLFTRAFVLTIESLADRGEDFQSLQDEWWDEVQQMAQLVQGYSYDEAFPQDIERSVTGRRLFRTEKGLIGLGPRTLRPGDLVCIFFGSAVAYVLRPVGEHFLFLGECYVHGIMNGEALEEVPKRTRTFSII